jgi:4-amino-4-deoxy-L-arabinose transferase-like glycosyltransferase
MFNWDTMTRAQKRNLFLTLGLILACMWLYLAGHARYGLFDVDEGIFTQATIEMRHSGSLAMPTYNGEPRYHKPPLIYWLQDVAMGVFGEDSLYAARLPSALSALLTIALLGWWIVRVTNDRRWALVSSLIMALNISFLVVGRAATADGILNLTSLALVLWVIHVCFPLPAVLANEDKTDLSAAVVAERVRRVQARQTYWRWQWLVTAVLAALAFLAKGPIAWFPAIIVVLALMWSRRDTKELWRKVSPIKAGLMTLVLLLPWMVLLVATHGFGFFYEFFVVQNFGRYAGGLSNTQSSSPFYYVLVLAAGFFPWSFMLPVSIRQTLRGGLRGFRTNLASRDLHRALPSLCVVWAVVYIVFFSCSQTKLAHYIVPAYPALALLVGWYLTRVPRLRMPLWQVGVALLFGLVMAGLMLVLNPTLVGLREPVLHGWLGWLQAAVEFPWPPKDVLARAVLAEHVQMDPAPYLIGIVMVLCVLPALVMVGQGKKGAVLLLGGTWAVCLGLIAWGIVPVVWNYTQAPLTRLAMMLANAPDTTPIVHLGLHKPTVRYLSGKPFLKLDKPLQLPDYLTAPETLVLTKETLVQAIATEVATKGGAQVLGQVCDGGYCVLVVARPKAALVDSALPGQP